MTLLYSLILTHMAADFLQPASLVKLSKTSSFGLVIHTLSYTLLTAVFLYGARYWFAWLMLLAVSHYLLDQLKYFSSRIGLKSGPVYLFILDQVMHMSVVAAVTMGIIYTGTLKTPVLELLGAYDKYILLIGGLIAGTTGVSILIFEMDRTFFSDKNDVAAVIDIKTRIVGLTERGAAMVFIFLGLPYIAPLVFVYSFYGLMKGLGKEKKTQAIVDFCVSAGSAFIIAFAVMLLS